jgi:GntR family transcriptional regulator
LKTQQGAGSFISKTEDLIPEKERKDKLKEICIQFSFVALSYGFSLSRIIQELQHIGTSKK